MKCCLSAGRFLPTPGLFLCLILAKGNCLWKVCGGYTVLADFNLETSARR